MRPIAMLFALLLLGGSAAAQLDKDPKYVKTRVERMLAQFDYATALRYLEQAERTIPKDGEIRILKGETLFLLERHDEAATAYEAGLALKPELRGRITNLPLALVRAGRLAEAKVAAEKLLGAAEDDHGRANGRFIIGLVAWNSGELEAALRELELAVRLEPRLTKAWYRLGLVHLHENRCAEAAQAFERALELDHLHHAAAHNLALAALRLGDQERAKEARARHARIIAARRELLDLQAGLEKSPRDPALLRRMADIHFDFGSFHEAAPIYAAVTSANPDDLEPRLRFMRCKFETRDYHDARVQAQIILQREPENAEARRILDAILVLIGEKPAEENGAESRPAAEERGGEGKEEER